MMSQSWGIRPGRVGLSLQWWLAVIASFAALQTEAAEIAIKDTEAPVGSREVMVPVLLDRSGSEAVSGLQFDVRFPADKLKYVGTEPGEAALSADKQLSAEAMQAGHVRVLIAGLNLNIIGSGVVARLRFTLDDNTIPDTYALVLQGVLAPDVRGRKVQTTIQDGVLRVIETSPTNQGAWGCTSGHSTAPGATVATGDGIVALVALCVMAVAQRRERVGS